MLGLVGGIGAGKSTLARSLERRGAVVLDLDSVGHALLTQRPVRELILARFGPVVAVQAARPAGAESDGAAVALESRAEPDEPPEINRATLGAIVFQDPKALRDLEAILHPRMRRTIERVISRTVRAGVARAVVVDAAILFEAGWDDLCDLVLFVEASAAARAERVAARGWSPRDLERRERAQWPLERKREAADLVVENDAAPDDVEPRLDRFWRDLTQSWRLADLAAARRREAAAKPAAPPETPPAASPGPRPRRPAKP